MSAIARHLGVDRATCYPMLRELCDYGWLVREPHDKRFHLGPSLVAVGSTAKSSVGVADAARPMMAELADATDIACVLICRSDDDLVVTEVTHPSSGRRPTLGLRIGDTYGFQAPLGAVFAAWDGGATVADWLGQSGTASPAMHAALRAIRKRGFAVEALERPRDLEREVEAARSVALSRRAARATIKRLAAEFPPDTLVGELRCCASRQVLTLSAPVFGARGPAAALCLFDPSTSDATALAELGRQLAEGAASVTASLTRETISAGG